MKAPQKHWEAYRKLVYGDTELYAEQYAQLEMAFYAGMLASFTAAMESTDREFADPEHLMAYYYKIKEAADHVVNSNIEKADRLIAELERQSALGEIE